MFVCTGKLASFCLDNKLELTRKHKDIIVDGNMAPTNDFSQYFYSRGEGYEKSLHHFFDLCEKAKFSCPLYHKGPIKMLSAHDIEVQYKALLDNAIKHGIPTSKKYAYRPFTAAKLVMLLNKEFESSRNWKALASALNQAITMNNADELMGMFSGKNKLYNPFTDTYPDIKKDSIVDGNAAVMCLDYDTSTTSSKKSWMKAVATLRQNYPLIGAAAVTGNAGHCIHWPVPNNPLLPENVKSISSPGKVLLIANEYDPVTPDKNSQWLERYLTNLNIDATLLTWNGIGHAAFLVNAPKDGCVYKAVETFYLTGKLPNNSDCRDAKNPFLKSASK